MDMQETPLPIDDNKYDAVTFIGALTYFETNEAGAISRSSHSSHRKDHAYPVASQAMIPAGGHDWQRVGDRRAARKHPMNAERCEAMGLTLKCGTSDATQHSPSWELTG
jgi:hypothetical protein